ncbi:uncharacterized protein LOC144873457 isoform X2 [Branchiostoma floridae x Branchiostoma japonicum]
MNPQARQATISEQTGDGGKVVNQPSMESRTDSGIQSMGQETGQAGISLAGEAGQLDNAIGGDLEDKGCDGPREQQQYTCTEGPDIETVKSSSAYRALKANMGIIQKLLNQMLQWGTEANDIINEFTFDTQQGRSDVDLTKVFENMTLMKSKAEEILESGLDLQNNFQFYKVMNRDMAKADRMDPPGAAAQGNNVNHKTNPPQDDPPKADAIALNHKLLPSTTSKDSTSIKTSSLASHTSTETKDKVVNKPLQATPEDRAPSQVVMPQTSYTDATLVSQPQGRQDSSTQFVDQFADLTVTAHSTYQPSAPVSQSRTTTVPQIPRHLNNKEFLADFGRINSLTEQNCLYNESSSAVTTAVSPWQNDSINAEGPLQNSTEAPLQSSTVSTEGSLQNSTEGPLQNSTISISTEGSLQNITINTEGALQNSTINTEGLLQNSTEDPLQNSSINTEGSLQNSTINTEGSLQNSTINTEGSLQNSTINTEGPLQNSIEGPLQNSIEAPLQNNTEGSLQNNTDGPLQSTDHDGPLQNNTEGPLQNSTDGPLQNSTKGPLQNTINTEGSLQNSTKGPLQNTINTEGSLQNSTKGLLQNNTEGPMQNSTEGPLQNSTISTEDPLQNSTINTEGSLQDTGCSLQKSTINTEQPLQNSTEGPLKNSTEGPLKNSTEGPLKSSTISTEDPLQNSTINTEGALQDTGCSLQNSTINTEDPLQNSTINTEDPLQKSTINNEGPLQNSIEGPLQNSTEGPLQNSTQGPLQNSTEHPLQNSTINTEGSLQNSIEGPLQNNTEDPLQNSTINNEGPLQNSIEGPLQNSTEGPLQNSTQGPLQNNTEGPLQNNTEGPLQNNTEGPLQNNTEGPLQNNTEGPLQNSTEGPLQNSTEGPLQNNTINTEGPLQNSTEHPLQNSTINTEGSLQNSIEGPLQNNTEGPLQNNTEGPLQNNTEGPLQNNTEGPLQNSTKGPLQNSTEGPLQNNTINTEGPLQNSTINTEGPLQNSTEHPLQNSTERPLQNSTEGPLQNSTQVLLQNSTQVLLQKILTGISTRGRLLNSTISTEGPLQNSDAAPLQWLASTKQNKAINIDFLKKISDSVGTIVRDNHAYGTCFRLGFGPYVITNCHVAYFAKLLRSYGPGNAATAYVDFEYSNPQSTLRFYIKRIIFAKESLDYCILKLEVPADQLQYLPPGLGHLVRPIGNSHIVHVIGCPDWDRSKYMNHCCPMLSYLDQVHLTTLKNFKINLTAEESDLLKSYERIVYFSIFGQRSSGSVVVDDRGYIVAMHTRGFPSHGQSQVEQGVKLSAIRADLRYHKPVLWAEFFPRKTYMYHHE